MICPCSFVPMLLFDYYHITIIYYFIIQLNITNRQNYCHQIRFWAGKCVSSPRTPLGAYSAPGPLSWIKGSLVLRENILKGWGKRRGRWRSCPRCENPLKYVLPATATVPDFLTRSVPTGPARLIRRRRPLAHTRHSRRDDMPAANMALSFPLGPIPK